MGLFVFLGFRHLDRRAWNMDCVCCLSMKTFEVMLRQYHRMQNMQGEQTRKESFALLCYIELIEESSRIVKRVAVNFVLRYYFPKD